MGAFDVMGNMARGQSFEGNNCRFVTVPEGIQADGIAAAYENGVPAVTLPMERFINGHFCLLDVIL